jgi:hypothetical protein
MGTIRPPAPPVKPVAFFDRIQIWLRRPADRATLAKLRKQCGHLHVDDRYARFDWSYRQRIEFKQPQSEVLKWMAGLPADTLINRAEIALDYCFNSAAEREQAFEYLHRHLIRRWHSSKQKILIVRGTRYDAGRAAPNSIPFYREDHSRITGEVGCWLHLEWRANGGRAVRAAGISSVRDLPDFDHHTFWKGRMLLLDGKPELLGKFLRNHSTGKRSRVATPDDSKAGQLLLNRFETMQELMDEYSKLRIRRVMNEIPNQAWLPSMKRRRVNDQVGIIRRVMNEIPNQAWLPSMKRRRVNDQVGMRVGHSAGYNYKEV